MTGEFQPADLARPYLVIPKLIEQPTWGGEYIAESKGWQDHPELAGKRIGQSYELFSGSNLSLCESTDDPGFVGELADRDSVQLPSIVPNSVTLQALIDASPEDVLGADIVKQRGSNINLLIKFTQALGNSFQVHLRDGQTDPHWVPKLESWYYFEPGLLTLGVKAGASWDDYQAAVIAVDVGMHKLSAQVQSGELSYEDAKPKIQELVERYDPWQFVNMVEVDKDALVDLSEGGVHHSWEEDTERFPLGNVLYEIQTDTMDDVGTLRSFDRGKMGSDGSVRDVHIDDYFRVIDRSPEANDPQTHMRSATVLASTATHELVELIRTPHYGLDKLTVTGEGSEYRESITQFCHLFVKLGRVSISTAAGTVEVGAGHSCFVPAAAAEYVVRSQSPDAVVLVSR